MNYKFNVVFKRNDNTELIMNETSDFRLIDIKGIEASSYSVNTEDSEQDGANVTSVKVEPREITVEGDIDKNANEDVNRDFLIRFFNPHSKGEMFITRNNISRKIEYKVSDLSFPTNKMYEYIDFTLSLECIEDPYFSDSKNKGNYLTLINPHFTFPLAIHKTKGRIMGYKCFNPIMPLQNDGDKETGLEIVITARRGKMDNIKLILNNKEFIKVYTTLQQGDILKINTNPRKKSVTLNGENIIHKIDRKSLFFSLKIGKNILKYECDNGETNVDINVLFFRKFLGI